MITMITVFVLGNLFPSLYLLTAQKSRFPFKKTSIKVFTVLTGVGLLTGSFAIFGEYGVETSAHIVVGWIIFSNVAFYSVLFKEPMNNRHFINYFGTTLIKKCFLFVAWLSIFLGLYVIIALEAHLYIPDYKQELVISGLAVFVAVALWRGRVSQRSVA